MNLIPNNISCSFGEVLTRRAMIQEFGDSKGLFFGENEDGEAVVLTISSEKGMVLQTFQENGWLRVNTYDVQGNLQDEMYQGRWRYRSETPPVDPKQEGRGLIYTISQENASGMEFTAKKNFMQWIAALIHYAEENGSVHFEVDIEKETT